MSSTAVSVREPEKTFDLTRAPSEQWDKEMVELVARTVFRGQEVTQNALYFCLSVADGLNLNPMIGEVYFIPSKSRDGKGPLLTPYIGRNGLVKKATERHTYYESETVRENDKFRMTRKRDGTVEVTHSYGAADRGKILGAYAFLHDDDGMRKPAFFYARWEEYAPKFADADMWKLEKSPWGNQESAMMEKCAMIGAGRKRLDMGNLLADGEIGRVQQMQEMGPGRVEVAAEPAAFDFAALTRDAGLAGRLAVAAPAAGWSPAKSQMVMAGKSDAELLDIAQALEDVVERTSPVEPNEEEIVDAQVVADPSPEDLERAEAMRVRISDLTERLHGAEPGGEEERLLSDEIDAVGAELGALTNPGQGSLV